MRTYCNYSCMRALAESGDGSDGVWIGEMLEFVFSTVLATCSSVQVNIVYIS